MAVAVGEEEAEVEGVGDTGTVAETDGTEEAEGGPGALTWALRMTRSGAEDKKTDPLRI